MKWNEAFKPPFSVRSITILDANYGMCMNTFMNETSTQKMLDKLNGVSNHSSKKGQFSLSEDKQTILYNGQKIFHIRGWGRLTGKGGLNLPFEEAMKLQDEFAEWIVETLNS